MEAESAFGLWQLDLPPPFECSEADGFRLTPTGFKTFIGEYERMLQSPARSGDETHQLTWRELLRQSVEQWKTTLRSRLSPAELAADSGAITEEDFDQQQGLSSPVRFPDAVLLTAPAVGAV